MNFRYDINGLRAYAVVLVVLFHFGVLGFRGGFIGVDIFFVISGFLMTKIIMDGLRNDNFSILQFYTNRATRIIPALAILCLFLLIFGWFDLIPTDYKALAKHIIASLFFISNVIYWRESGYFDVDSHDKILLHTWSLSVEWQFYIILPIYCLIAFKIFKNNLIYSLVILFIASLFLAQYLAIYKPSAAFYLLPSRAWEMLLGGFIYFLPRNNFNQNKSKILEYLGFGLIVVSLFLFTSNTPWSSVYTLVPTLGTALILYAQNQTSILTRHKVFQVIGNASYSIYLWHWPIVYYLHAHDKLTSLAHVVVGLMLSFILGYISSVYVEKRIGNKLKSKKIIISNLFILIVCSIISIFAYLVFLHDGVKNTLRSASNSPKALFIEKYFYEHKQLDDAYQLKCDVYWNLTKNGFNGVDKSCVQSVARLSNSIFLWGDSHSQALSLGLRKSFPENKFYQVGSSGCHASTELSNTSGDFKKACDEANQLALIKIKELEPSIVVIAQANEHDKTNWLKLINQLETYGVKKIIIVGAVPQWRPSLPKVMIKEKNFDNTESKIHDPGLDLSIIESDKRANRIVNDLAKTNVKYISLIQQMCDFKNQKYYCEAKLQDGDLIQVDYGHLSQKGSIYVVSNYIKQYID